MIKNVILLKSIFTLQQCTSKFL